MAFIDFTSADQVQTAYRIQYTEADFIKLVSLAPPESFVLEYEFSKNNFDIFSSEASRCEAVIYPILREVCKQFIRLLRMILEQRLTISIECLVRFSNLLN